MPRNDDELERIEREAKKLGKGIEEKIELKLDREKSNLQDNPLIKNDPKLQKIVKGIENTWDEFTKGNPQAKNLTMTMDKQGNINNPANAANASQFAQPFMQALIQKNAQNAFLNPTRSSRYCS
jgi:hypothetical protein